MSTETTAKRRRTARSSLPSDKVGEDAMRLAQQPFRRLDRMTRLAIAVGADLFGNRISIPEVSKLHLSDEKIFRVLGATKLPIMINHNQPDWLHLGSDGTIVTDITMRDQGLSAMVQCKPFDDAQERLGFASACVSRLAQHIFLLRAERLSPAIRRRHAKIKGSVSRLLKLLTSDYGKSTQRFRSISDVKGLPWSGQVSFHSGLLDFSNLLVEYDKKFTRQSRLYQSSRNDKSGSENERFIKLFLTECFEEIYWSKPVTRNRNPASLPLGDGGTLFEETPFTAFGEAFFCEIGSPLAQSTIATALRPKAGRRKLGGRSDRKK